MKQLQPVVTLQQRIARQIADLKCCQWVSPQLYAIAQSPPEGAIATSVRFTPTQGETAFSAL